MQIQWLIRALLAFPLAVLAAEAPPPPVAQALRAAGIPTGAVGISIQEVGAPRPALSVNPTLPLNPASSMKLVTTFAGLELLGPAYRWRTEAFLGGALREGALEGDLILKGTGDPKLNLEAFWMLLRDLRSRGLKDIRGDLVLDRSHYATVDYDAARFDGESLRPYNVGPDPLLLNFKSIRLLFSPDPERGAVRVTAEPRIVDTVSVVRLAEGVCGDWRERLASPRPVYGDLSGLLWRARLARRAAVAEPVRTQPVPPALGGTGRHPQWRHPGRPGPGAGKSVRFGRVPGAVRDRQGHQQIQQ